MKIEKKYKKLIFTRAYVTGFLVLVQLMWIISLFIWLYNSYKYLDLAIRVLSLVFTVYVVNSRHEKNEYKIIWIIVVLAFPIFGVPFYFFTGEKKPGRGFLKRLKKAEKFYDDYNKQRPGAIDAFAKLDPRGALTSKYIIKDGNYPVSRNSGVEYYKQGEEIVASMMEELKKAKRFIFLEYFTIEPGQVWLPILEILKEKAKEGVEIRIIYDDFGSVAYLPKNYYKQLNEIPNFKCLKFNRIVPFFSMFMNNRDHRKMTIIDGAVAFTGGINLVNRYVNIDSPYGHWKDAGVRVRGDAVWNMTLMFLEMWDAVRKDSLESENPKKYLPENYEWKKYENGGFVQPYADEPFDDINLSENIYMEMISQADDYAYVYTPYLIMSDELTSAFCLAAKRGVDVRIVTPGIPDKKIVYRATRSSYPKLLKAGVKIYEYTPGFIHSKCMLIDGKSAVVGTINFDYRSLFLHFENGVFFAANKAVTDLQKDMIATFKICKEVKMADTKKSALGRVFDSVLAIFAPMM